jgi:hypothetical protein
MVLLKNGLQDFVLVFVRHYDSVMDDSRPCPLFSLLGTIHQELKKCYASDNISDMHSEKGTLSVVDQYLRSLSNDDWYSAGNERYHFHVAPI